MCREESHSTILRLLSGKRVQNVGGAGILRNTPKCKIAERQDFQESIERHQTAKTAKGPFLDLRLTPEIINTDAPEILECFTSVDSHPVFLTLQDDS